MPLRLQKIEFPDAELRLSDCLQTIVNGYLEWGRQPDVDPPINELNDEQKRDFILRGYRLYDGCPVPHDNVLTIHDICVSVMINSFVILYDVRRFLSRNDEISALLEDIDPEQSLLDATEELLERVGNLVDNLSEMEHIGFSKVTKVLHKKRPRLIPVRDGYVFDALHKNFPWLLHNDGNAPFSQVLRVYRNAQRRVQDQLGELTAALRAEWQIELSEGRALSYLVWNWRRQFVRLQRPCTLQALWGGGGEDGRDAARQMWEGP